MPTETGDSATPILDLQASAPPPRPRSEGPALVAAPRTPGGAARHVRVVDGLRGIAILLVLLFHYWQLSWWVIPIPGLPDQYNLEFVQYAGFLGVELFFFISAFCLFYPHAKAMFGAGPVPTLKHFYYRRAIKILPSYLLALFVFGMFFSNLYTVTYKHGVLADLGLHLIFLHDLLPETRSSFDGVLWSLAVEVQFYYIFPLLAKAFRRFPWLTAASIVAVALSYRAWAQRKPLEDFSQWDSQLPGFLDLFAFGMLAAYLLVWIRQREASALQLRYAFTMLAVAGFVTMLMMFRWTYSVRYDAPPPEVWQSNNRHYLGLLFLCITIASTFAIGLWRKLLANRVLLFLSTISYNLYIWHQSIGLLIRDRHWWKADTPTPMEDPHWRWTYMIVAVTASIIVASVITYGFERPLLRLGVRGAIWMGLAKLATLNLMPASLVPMADSGPDTAAAQQLKTGPSPGVDVPTAVADGAAPGVRSSMSRDAQPASRRSVGG
jgi:peptidoglycan/LPS O-acetylase OafA/YrhL